MNLEELEARSIYVVREIKSQFKNPVMLWSTGKDSTALLWMIKKAFFNKIPFPVLHIDTGYKFPEMYEYRDSLTDKLKLNLIVERNNGAISRGITPFTHNKFECCTRLKTDVLKQSIEKKGFDAVIVSIRRDEHGIRNKERYMSPRNKEFKWTTHHINKKNKIESSQDMELSGWGIYATEFPDAHHVRIHPILHWSEIDIWQYIKRESIPVNPLYFSHNNERYRSLGCKPCTEPIKSKASTIDEIIEELKTTDIQERDGRMQDKETLNAMEKLRVMGYM